jgi:SSS family solute:Na+ symporter
VYDFWPHYLLLSFYLFVLIAVMTWAVTLYDRKNGGGDENTLDYGNIPKPSRKVWIAWISLIIFMIGMYILFNGH